LASYTPLTGQHATMDIDSTAKIILAASTVGQSVDFDKLPTALQIAGIVGAFIASLGTVILGLRAKNRPAEEGISSTGGVAIQLLQKDVERHDEELKDLRTAVHDIELEQARMGGTPPRRR
jgi:hypothetical protein